MQVKSINIISLVRYLSNSLILNNDLGINVCLNEEKINITYLVCVRRDTPYSVAKKYEKRLNEFVSIVNSNPLSRKKKIIKFDSEVYNDDTEYSEYEISFERGITLSIGKNQENELRKHISEIRGISI